MPNFTAKEIIDREQPDLFHHQRRDPMVLGGMFTELTRNLYASQSHMLPATKSWNDQDEKGRPFIEASYIWDDENNNRRPAVIVDVGDLMYSTSKVQGIGGKAFMNMAEGEYGFSRLVKGSVVWMNIGRNRGQALQYGCVTLDLVDAFADIIQRDFCFEKFEVRGILKPRQRKDQPLEFECRVQADFEFQETFQLKLESPKLKTISATKQVINC